MAFQSKYRSYSFKPVSVKQNAPPLPGVYALSNATEWVLVGVADDVRPLCVLISMRRERSPDRGSHRVHFRAVRLGGAC